jgi:hypothetical protein
MKRITFRYLDGPLGGCMAYHHPLPEKPAEPTFHPRLTCHEGSDIDLEAGGLYHLEQREIKLPWDIPADAPQEFREKRMEWVAVHHPSDKDQEWREQVKAAPAPPAPDPKPDGPAKPKKKPIELRADHPWVKKLARIADFRKRRKPSE